MQLSPEERRRIYEEEKARIEAEREQRVTGGASTTGLEPRIAALLCYLGGWITGIIFLVIEQENKFVRFHALQSTVTFGALTVAGALLGRIPFAGSFLGAIIGILAIVLWILLMVKAHQGELYRLPVAGQVAEGVLPVGWRAGGGETGEEQETAESTSPDADGGPPAASSTATSDKTEKAGRPTEDYYASGRGARVAAYSFAIVFDVALLVFFSFFHRYIAWYHVGPGGGVTRLPLLTGDYLTWLPLLIAALVISIAAYIVLIAYDRYWLREIVEITLMVIGIVVVANLVAIFPFDFSVIPNATVADVMPVLVTVALIITAVGLGVGVLVRFVKFMVTMAQ